MIDGLAVPLRPILIPDEQLEYELSMPHKLPDTEYAAIAAAAWSALMIHTWLIRMDRVDVANLLAEELRKQHLESATPAEIKWRYAILDAAERLG